MLSITQLSLDQCCASHLGLSKCLRSSLGGDSKGEGRNDGKGSQVHLRIWICSQNGQNNSNHYQGIGWVSDPLQSHQLPLLQVLGNLATLLLGLLLPLARLRHGVPLPLATHVLLRHDLHLVGHCPVLVRDGARLLVLIKIFIYKYIFFLVFFLADLSFFHLYFLCVCSFISLCTLGQLYIIKSRPTQHI